MKTNYSSTVVKGGESAFRLVGSTSIRYRSAKEKSIFFGVCYKIYKYYNI